MKLVNRTRGTVVAAQVERAGSMRARMKGLLGRDGLAEGSALVIEPCTSIHTFFMRFTIDVLFLDRRGAALRALGALKPWRATRVYPSAALVVELPEGALARSGTLERDLLAFEEA